jgi:hypothetical protein
MAADPDLSNIKRLQQDEWAKAAPAEREQALQETENQLAASQNRPACNLVYFDADKSNCGAYSPRTPDRINLNRHYLESDDPRDAVNTVAHEGRHAYQHRCIMDADAHPETDPKQIAEWRHNFSNYKSAASDYDAYRNQPIEADAFAYGDRVQNRLYPESVAKAGADEPIEGFQRREQELSSYRAEHWYDKAGIADRERALQTERTALGLDRESPAPTNPGPSLKR